MLEENTEKSQLDLAREAGNTWVFEGREMEMFVANGTMKVAVEVLDRKTQQPSGNVLIHSFAWEKNKPFQIHQSKFKTTYRRVGKNLEQEIDGSDEVTANAELYISTILEGIMVIPTGNGQTRQEIVSREKMLEFARLYPETASEAVESWLEGWHFELIDETDGSYDWMFSEFPTVKVLGWLGERANPSAAVILTFRTPTTEKRAVFEDERHKVTSRKQQSLNISEVSESFVKKLDYGMLHLESVEGVAVGEPGIIYNQKLKDRFITLFNPLAFADAVEVMHESFNFTKRKAAKN